MDYFHPFDLFHAGSILYLGFLLCSPPTASALKKMAISFLFVSHSRYELSRKSIFDCLVHDFTASKLASHQTIWVDKNFLIPDGDLLADSERLRRFGDTFAYMIPGGECFEALTFDRSDSRTLQAERYGGAGVGDNGGGVRCGNIGAYQIKEIGQKPLAGKAADVGHSYGGLSAIDAFPHSRLGGCKYPRCTSWAFN